MLKLDNKALMISFKLILSIIIGSIILIFFINFAYKHMRTSETLGSAKLANSLELELDILGTSLSVFKELDILDNKLNFDCNAITITYGKKFFRNPTDKIIAANTELTNKFNILSLAWNYPFKITNFYYATNKPLYIENSKLKEKLRSFTFTNEGNLPDFIKKIDYFSDEMLLLAYFSKDLAHFNCLKQKAIKKLEFISSLYQKKASYLKSRSSQDCALIYSQLITSLESFKTNFNKDPIETLNRELRNKNCPTLY